MNDEQIYRVLEVITPENIKLGHTWLKRKVREELVKIKEEDDTDPDRDYYSCSC